MSLPASMIFNILIKKEENLYIAHCLELDIVSTSTNIKELRTEILALLVAQIDYAFSNNNLDYLYHPAPPSAWQEFYSCKDQIEKKIKIKSSFSQETQQFVPPWIIARTCQPSVQSCYV